MPSNSFAVITVQVPLSGDTERKDAMEARRHARSLAELFEGGHVVDIRAYHEPSGSGEPVEIPLYENRRTDIAHDDPEQVAGQRELEANQND